MSDFEMHEHVAGAPWKALLARDAEGKYVARVWAIDTAGNPQHSDGAQALGLDIERCVCSEGGHPTDGRAMLYRVPEGERDALEAALRMRIPGVEFVPESNPWVFG